MGLRPASRVRPEESSDGQERPGRRPRFLPESLATEHDYGSPMSPGAASHRGPGTVPVQQTQQASSPHAPAGSAGGEGESSSAPPGYAEFVASAVRSAIPNIIAEFVASTVCGICRVCGIHLFLVAQHVPNIIASDATVPVTTSSIS